MVTGYMVAGSTVGPVLWYRSIVPWSDRLTKLVMTGGQWETGITIECVIYNQRFQQHFFFMCNFCSNYVLIFTKSSLFNWAKRGDLKEGESAFSAHHYIGPNVTWGKTGGYWEEVSQKCPTAVCFLICSRKILQVFDGKPNPHEWLN